MTHKIVKSRGVMQKTEEVQLDQYVQEKLNSFNVQEQRLANLINEIADWVEDSESEELKAYHEDYKHLPAKFEVEEDDSEDADESTEEISSEESEEPLSEEDETEDA